jgi:HK97 family phage prohead protease
MPVRADRMLRFDFDPGTAPTATATELSGIVVPYGQVVTKMGVPLTFARGSLDLPADLSTVKLLVQHDQDRPVGYATAATETDAGLHMTLALTEHIRSQALSDEVALKLRDGLSVGVEFDAATYMAITDAFWDEPDGPITVHGQLREVSAVSVPAFNDARAATNETRALSTFAADPAPADPPPPAVDPGMTAAQLAEQLRPLLFAGPAAQPAHPLAGFASFGDAWMAVQTQDVDQFALVDQVIADNPGVVPPSWLTEIRGIIDTGRPGVVAFGGASSPGDSGMDLFWPYFDGDFSLLVGVQATEKTEITSVKVPIKRGTATLKTYAGGSDISYQLIRRSSPAYRDAYLRIMAIGYGVTTDNAFVDAVTAAATAGPIWAPATGTSDQLRGALFAASAMVQKATGSPASFVLAAEDMFVKFGGLAGLWPATYGTQNVSGTADAASLRISVAGLQVILDSNLAAGTVLVSNEQAATWAEDGPFPVSAEDVAKLGQNVALWGMGATAVFLTKGIIKLPAA